MHGLSARGDCVPQISKSNPDNPQRLLIAIPVHNEQKTVSRVLDKVLQFHSEILTIDDGSTDGTSDILAARSDVYSLRHPRNLGYGKALIDAFDWADAHGFDW